MNDDFDPANTELASGFTVTDYRRACYREDAARIAEAIEARFLERYLRPVSQQEKHGFTMMAIACLMIEAFQSLRNGQTDTRGKSEKAFIDFFETERVLFGSLVPFAKDFYKNVRCGILHQAETTNGWRIRRKGELFDTNARTINATRFLVALETVLHSFCSKLADSEWNSSQWRLVRVKINYICDECSKTQNHAN